MPSARLLSRVVSAASSVSAGAVLAGQDGPDAPSVAADLLNLVAETTCADARAQDGAVRELERLTIRYGTLGGALTAIASGRRRPAGIAIDKTQAWARSLGASVSAVEATLRRYPRIMLEISRWISAEGDALERRLEEYQRWLDSDAPNATAEAAPVSAPTPKGSGGAPPIPDVALARRLMLDNKPLSDAPSSARWGALEQEVIDRLRGADDVFARATGMVASGAFADFDSVARELTGADAADIATLKGDRRYFAGAFEEAVEQYRAARAARDDAAARLNLAAALARSRRPSAEAAQKEAIDLLKSTMEGAEPGSRVWAIASARQGSIWLHLPSGDRDANVRRAIERLEAALTAIHREGDADWWAQIHAQLGAAWMALPSGKRVENLQRAITCFTRAGEVWTRESDPERWAAVQNGLGHAWEQLPLGHRAVNLEKAIGYFTGALEVVSRETNPTAWAMLQNNLGNAWVQMPKGELRRNVERAIECHSAALDVWSSEDRRHEWAATQNNLGNAWALLPAETTEERDKSLRRAAACYKAALEVRTRAAAAAEWAATQNNMGSVLLHLAKTSGGARALEEATACFERALEVRTREAYPLDWARTRANLGHAWLRRSEGADRETALRAAIACYSDALQVLKREQYPHLHDHIKAKLDEAQDRLDEASLLR